MTANDADLARQALAALRSGYESFEGHMDQIEHYSEEASMLIDSEISERFLTTIRFFEGLTLEQVQSIRIGDLKKCSAEEAYMIRVKAMAQQIEVKKKRNVKSTHGGSSLSTLRDCETIVKVTQVRLWRPKNIKLNLPVLLDHSLIKETSAAGNGSNSKIPLPVGLNTIIMRWVISGLPLIQRDAKTITKSTTAVGRDGNPIKFNRPYGLAIHPFTNRVYVADREHSRIVMLNGEDLSLVGTFGQYGRGPGDLYEPVAVAVSPDGTTLAISDQYNHRVVLVNSEDGKHIRTLLMKDAQNPIGVSKPHGICYDSRGHLYVADNDIGLVLHFDPEGDFVETIGVPDGTHQMAKPEGLMISDDNTLLVAGSGGSVVSAFCPVTGAFLRSFDIKPLAKGAVNSNTLARGPDGGFVVCDRNHDTVHFYSSTGEHLHSISAPCPMGAIFDIWNRLLLPCTEERVIYIC